MIIPLLIMGIAQAEQRDITATDLRCGAYCLYVSLRSLDAPVGTFKDFEAKLGQPTDSGYSLQQLASCASSYGLHTLGIQTSVDLLSSREGRFACIAFLQNRNHYVCIYDIDDDTVHIIDPPKQYMVSKDAFRAIWAGKALLISTAPLSPLAAREYAPWLILPGAGLLIALGFVVSRLYRHRRSARQHVEVHGS